MLSKKSARAKCEDPVHYLLLCPTYELARADFLESICQLLHDNNIEVDFNSNQFVRAFIDMILNGTQLLDETLNLEIFKFTQTYIRESKRFP
jgi:hypothetical protein